MASSDPRDPHVHALPATSPEQLSTYARAAFDGIPDLADDVAGVLDVTPLAREDVGGVSIRVSLATLGMLAERILNLRAGIAFAGDELERLRADAALDAGSEWVADDRRDGVREVQIAHHKNPLAAVEAELAAIQRGPQPATPAGVRECFAPHTSRREVRCTRDAGHTGWHRAGISDESHRARVRAAVWWGP